MPFKSEKQRKYLWAKHPEIAGRWEEEEKRRRKRKKSFKKPPKDRKK